MKYIISKKVVALYDAPGDLLNYEYFRNIRRQLFNEDPAKQTEESGDKKKTVMTEIGYGSNDRQNNPGAGLGDDRSSSLLKPLGVGSGYNDGEAANDEVGPGFTTTQPDPYYAVDVNNSVFFDVKYMNAGRDSKTVRHNFTKNLFNNPVKPKTKFDVDQLAQKERAND